MKILFKLVRMAVLVATGLVAYFYLRQESMMYKPRPYRDDVLSNAPRRAVKIEYKISCGSQTSWYVPPRSATDPHALPARLWIMFGGNGSLALHWSHVIEASPDSDAGFVLFDYPGYGQCEGKPSPESIAESGDAMLLALGAYLNVTPETLKAQKLRLMGHSLGSGVAMAFATRHEVDRIVLVAPFSSAQAMADRVVTPLMGWLIRHKWDNRIALDTVARQLPPPQVIITHGDDDNIVPVEMARELKRASPNLVDYIEVPGADHGNILDGVEFYMAPELPRPLTSLKQAREAAENIGETSGRAKATSAPASLATNDLAE